MGKSKERKVSVMENETADQRADRPELYRLLEEGLADIEAGRERSLSEVIAELRAEIDKAKSN
jgi:predicted transcriptional regulator